MEVSLYLVIARFVPDFQFSEPRGKERWAVLTGYAGWCVHGVWWRKEVSSKRPSAYTLNVLNIKCNAEMYLFFSMFKCLCAERLKEQNDAHPQTHSDKLRSWRWREEKKAGKHPDHWHRQTQPLWTLTEERRFLLLAFYSSGVLQKFIDQLLPFLFPESNGNGEQRADNCRPAEHVEHLVSHRGSRPVNSFVLWLPADSADWIVG